MADYFFTSRNIKRDVNGTRFFADEPAAKACYIIASPDAETMDPADRLTGEKTGQRWAKTVLAEARALGGHSELTDQNEPQGDIVVLVHGYNNDAKDAFEAHMDLAGNLRLAGLDKAVIVSYSWPAKGSFLNYLEDDLDARETALHLIKSGLALFAAFSNPTCRVRVHVVAHSMGCLVVREALRAAPGSKATRDSAWGIGQLVTFGADISKRSIAGSDGDRFIGHSQRYTNYFNRLDTVLATSNVKRFATAPRLGRHGAPDSRLEQMVDIDVTDHWRGVADDMNPIAGIPVSHNFYRRDMTFARDLAATLMGNLDRGQIPTREPVGDKGRMRLGAG